MRRSHIYTLAHGVKTKTKVLSASLLLTASSLGGGVPLFLSQRSFADSQTVINSVTSQGWTVDDTRANGHTALIADSSAPLGQGALSLKTDTSPTAGQDKAQFDHYLTTGLPLSDASGALSYYTKQNSASFSAGDPAYQIYLYMKGSDGQNDFNTLTFEPYVDQGNAAVQPSVWQKWTISQSSSKFYSSHNFSGQAGNVTASQGSSTYTLNQITAAFPNAQIVGYGVNIGSNNPGYDTEADAFTFNGTTYDFEPAAPAVPTDLRFENPAVACGGYTNVNHTTAAWDAVAGAVSYDYHVDGPNGLTYDANLTGTSNTGSFGSGAEGTYTFKVRSVDANGVKSAYSTPCSITYDKTAPSAPKLKSPKDSTTIHRHTFNFTWKAVSDASPVTYTWESASDKNFNHIVAEHAGLTSTTLSSPNTPNGKYYWRVKAVDAAGNSSSWSPTWSVTVQVYTLYAPELFSPGQNATVKKHSFNFTWGKVLNANGGKVTYQWQSSTSNTVTSDGAFANVLANHIGSARTLSSPNTPNGTYYWHVRALDAEGNPGAWSPVWKVTVNG